MAQNWRERFLEWNRAQEQSGTPVTDYITPVQEAKAARKTTGTSSTGSGNWSQDFINWNRQQNEEQAGNDINSWISASNGLLNRYGELAGSWRARNDAAYDDFNQRKSRLLSYAGNYRQMYQGNDDAINAINSVVNALSDTDLRGIRNYWSQWETKEDYDKAVQAQKDYEAMMSFDTQKGAEDIEALEKVLEKAERYKGMPSSNLNHDLVYAAAQQGVEDELKALGFSSYDEAKKKLSADKAYLSQATKLQERANFEKQATGAADFRTVSTAGMQTQDNQVAQFREGDNWKNSSLWFENLRAENPYYYAAKHMTDDEYAVYNYYLGKGEKEKAEQYLSSLQETINAREAGQIYEGIKGNALAEMMYAPEAGFDQFWSGIKGALNFSGEQTAPTITQYTSQLIREDLANNGPEVFGTSVGQGAYDLVTTGVNMFPSILASYATTALTGNPVLGQNLGTTLMGISAGGNAYQQMVNQGYDPGKAHVYGALIGLSEAKLESLLGGISALGGKLSNHLISKALSKLDKGFFKFAARFGLEMASEGIEEGLQDILEPLIKNAIFDTDETVDWEQVAYSALLGALSAGSMNAVTGGMNALIQNFENGYYKGAYGDKIAQIVDEALEINPENRLAQKMKAQIGSKQDVSGRNIRRLVQEVQTETYEGDQNKIRQAVTQQLQERGERANIERLADIITKGVSGEQITMAERAELAASQYGQDIVRELNNSTGIMAYSQDRRWTGDLGTKAIRPDIYNRFSENTQTEQTAPAAEQQTAAPISPDAWIEQQLRTQSGQQSVPNAAPATDVGTDASAETTGATESVAMTGREMPRNTSGRFQNVMPATRMTQANKAVPAAVNDMASDYGNQAAAIRSIYNMGTNKDLTVIAPAIRAAYEIGLNGGLESAAMNDSSTRALTPAQRSLAYRVGVAAANKAPKRGNASRRGTVHSDNFKIGGNKYRRMIYNAVNLLAEESGITIEMNDSQGKSVVQGGFNKDTDVLTLDISADINNEEDARKAIKYAALRTFSHELTHFGQKWSSQDYNALTATVLEVMADRYGDEFIEDRIRYWQDRYKNEAGQILSTADAIDEIVAESMTEVLPESQFFEKLIQRSQPTASRLIDALKKFIARLRQYFRNLDTNIRPEVNALMAETEDGTLKYLEGIVEQWDRMMLNAVENYNNALAEENVSTGSTPVEETTQNSIRSLAQAGGFKAEQDEYGNVILTRNGQRVSEVTVDDINHSPIGALINHSLDSAYISTEEAAKQKELFARLLTMAAQSNDFVMTMQLAGSSIFTALKSNADKQYKTTYDFPSICTKTQAVIDSMSAAMKAKHGGLTKREIERVYNEVFHDGNPVPCPECYVFSRWVGIGSLLDNIWTYQNKFGKMSLLEVQQAYARMEAEIRKVAEENDLTFGKAKGKIAKQYTDRYNALYEKVTKAQNQGEHVNKASIALLENLQDHMETVKAMTWIDTVYFKDSSHRTANPRSKWFVDPNVLFDLNEGETFATQYPEAWGFRTTQGAGYGKAITPYSEAVIGEGILGTNSVNNLVKNKKAGVLDNFFLRQNGTLDAQAKKTLETATKNQKNQAFLGGQRFQSTSDARYENAFDYLIAALEVQAMHGMVQAYTKVAGAVPAFYTWGFSTNQSLMPKGGGLDANGRPVDTAVGGMNPEVARRNREQFETQGTITIGVNDNHIRAMMDQIWRDFIIPYHASGGDATLVQSFRTIQESGDINAVRSTDYTRTQSDKILSDDALRYYYHYNDEQIDLIKARRKARLDIFAMNLGGEKAAHPDMEIVRGSRFLSALYDKLSEGGEWSGVTAPKKIVEDQLFPNEYWDQTVTYENSGKITRDYLEYCEELGFLHRFSGMVPGTVTDENGVRHGTIKQAYGYDENGQRVALTDLAYRPDGSINDYFWKVLTDRRMYDNDGNYLPQRYVTLGTTSAEDVLEFAGTKRYGEKAGRQYDPEISARTAARVAEEIANGTDTQENVQHAIRYPQYTQKDINDNSVALQSMSPVGHYTGNEIGDRSIVLKQRVTDFFNSLGNNVYTEQFGDVALRSSSVHSEFRHGHSPIKVITYAAIPNVLKNGKVIDTKAKTENMTERIVVAAPVTVGDPAEKMYVAVMLQRDPQSQRLYLHDAVIEKELSNTTARHLNPTGLDGNGKLFITDILLKALKVKPQNENSSNRQASLRTQAYTDRQLLEMAANDVSIMGGLTQADRSTLEIFKSRLDKLRGFEEQQAEQRRILQELNAAAKPDRDEITRTQNRINLLGRKISAAENLVLDVENKQTLKKVLQHARNLAGNQVRRNERARLQERSDVMKYRERVQAKAKRLSDMILKNSDKEHVPAALRGPLADFVGSIGFDSRRKMSGRPDTKRDIKYTEALDRLRQIVQNQADYMANPENGSSLDYYLDLPEDFSLLIQEHLNQVTEAVKAFGAEDNNQVFAMDSNELKRLDQILSIINHSVSTINKKFVEGRFARIDLAGQQTIWEMNQRRAFNRSKRAAAISGFFEWKNALPYYAFKRYGEAGQEIFHGIQRGWEKFAFNTQDLIAFTETAYETEEQQAWSNELHQIKLEDGSTVQMTTAQIMSLYCLNKREQARGHILGGGVRVGNIEAKQGRKTQTVTQTENFNLTPDDVKKITDMLTDRQREVADALQEYMNTVGTKWGNEVSMARFGYEGFGEKNYFPIESDQTNLPAKDPDAKANDLFRLLNMSMTKALTPKANNALVVSDIFQVFANHMSDMAKYNALALPVLDAMKWINYKESTEKNENGQFKTLTVQRAIEEAYGQEGMSYFMNFMKDLNGKSNGGRDEGVLNGLMSGYKIAAVAANLRVALLQPTAYFRASAVLKPNDMARAVTMNRRQAREERMKYSGISVWKDLGFYDTNIGRNVEDLIMHNETIRDKIADKALWLAEKGDAVTWDVIWNACKLDQQKKGLQGEELMKATAERFQEVIYRTQVVDSTLTRTQLMRDKSIAIKNITGFMSEPGMSYNLLLDAYEDFNTVAQREGKAQAWKATKGIVWRALGAYAASQLVAAIVESIADAARDDDDYESYLDKWLQAFLGDETFLKGNLYNDLSIMAKVPLLKMIPSYLQGYETTDMVTQGIKDLFELPDFLKSQSRPDYGKIYKVAQVASRLGGVPIGNAMREFATIWNNTVGVITGQKLKTYTPNDKTVVKEGYEGGKLTEQKAIDELVRRAGMEEKDAKAQVTKWKYSEWDTNGGGLSQEEVAIGLESGNFTEKEKQQIWKDMGFKKELTAEVKEKAKARVELDENAVVYNSANWQDGLKDTTLSNSDKDKLVTAYGGNWFAEPYMTLRQAGYTPSGAYDLLMAMDTDKNKSIKQAEAYKTLIGMSDQQALQIWNSFGWATSWEKYKARQH